MMEKIEITVDGNKTIAKMGGKKGVARRKCKSYSWLKMDIVYYIPRVDVNGLFDCFRYQNDEVDERYMSRGLVFETKEEAIEAANKMLAALKENDND